MLMVYYCDYSRWAFVEALTTYNEKTVTDRLETQFSIFGVPEEIRTDNGPPFQSAGFAEFSKKMGFKHRKVTPLWPRANGEVESFMKNLGKVIRTAAIDKVSWKQRLREFLRVYRATPHSTTKVAPNDLMFRNANTSRLPEISRFIPNMLDAKARENDENRKLEMKKEADLRLHAKPHSFSVGDFVLLKQRKLNKATTKFETDPYRVVEIKGNMIVAKNENKMVCRNVSFFAPFQSSVTTFQQKAPRTIATCRKPPLLSKTSINLKETVVGLGEDVETVVDETSENGSDQEEDNEEQDEENHDEQPGLGAASQDESFNSAETEPNKPETEGTGAVTETGVSEEIESQGKRYPIRSTRTQPATYRDTINKQRVSPSKQKKLDKRLRKSSAIVHISETDT